MVRKIYKTGNSLVVSLPKDSIQQLGLNEGSEVNIEIDQENGKIVIEPVKNSIAQISPEFAEQLDSFIEQYRPALEELAK
ncbi:MAG: AbrB/MazE/SpoVT family DNA-binding domain-containing protein [Chloroflexota bacterium]